MRQKFLGMVLGTCLLSPCVAGASTFIGTNIEDPASSGNDRLLQRTIQHGRVITQSAREHVHQLGLSQKSILMHQLQQGGIQVILLGDQVRMVIPSAVFFEPGTATLKQNKAEVMATMNAFVGLFPKSIIQVTGHSDFLGEVKQQQRYSKQIARVVAGYLWANGVAQNRMIVQGVGAEEPVTDSYTGGLNSRIEVLFEDKS